METDVVIMGFGVAGAATAIALRQAGVPRVTVVERPVQHHRFAVGESAVPSVPNMLERLGLASVFAELDILPYHGNYVVWGSGEPVFMDFRAHGLGSGWHLDRADFDSWLQRQAVRAGVERVEATRVNRLARTPADCWLIELIPDIEISSSFIIDATGRKAALATRLGVQKVRIDALVGHVVLADLRPGSRVAHYSVIEAVRDGWWYAAGIPDGRAIVAFMTDLDLARELSVSRIEAFRQLFSHTREISRQVQISSDVDAVHAYPAFSQNLQTMAGAGWLAVGDAAISLDPLTSSGISCALSDAIAAARAVTGWLNDQTSAVHAFADRTQAAWQRYIHERRDYYSRETRWPNAVFWRRRLTTRGIHEHGPGDS